MPLPSTSSTWNRAVERQTPRGDSRQPIGPRSSPHGRLWLRRRHGLSSEESRWVVASRLKSRPGTTNHDPVDVDGLIFLGYPLHPPGRPERRRDAHLPSIAAPMLFVQGSRDTFGTKDEMQPVVDACQDARLHIIEGGDHSLKVRGKDAPSPEDLYDSVQDVMADWIATL